MSATGYDRALARVLKHEGGYVNDPQDPGGATNFGITYRVYNGYRNRKGLPTRDVRQIDEHELSEIYRLQYWDAVKGDELPPGLDYVLFDGAVNSGPSQSIKWLQRALGVVADGQMGQATLAAVAKYPRLTELIDNVCDRRLTFLQALKTWPRFGRGWSSRVSGVRRVGKSWALGVPAPEVGVPTETGRGTIKDAKQAPGKGTADGATGSGGMLAVIAGILETIRQQLQPFADAVPWAGKVIAALIVVGGVLALGGFAYRWWAGRKAQQLADALDLEAA